MLDDREVDARTAVASTRAAAGLGRELGASLTLGASTSVFKLPSSASKHAWLCALGSSGREGASGLRAACCRGGSSGHKVSRETAIGPAEDAWVGADSRALQMLKASAQLFDLGSSRTQGVHRSISTFESD